MLSTPETIWGGTGGADPEGPHIYKRHGYYYLLISEGGTSLGHMVTAARSKHIQGPYEPCPRNPVLSNRSLSLPIKAAGHADLIEAHDGSWWAVCLGIRPVPYPDRHHLGRETMLAPVRWDEEGWPIIGHNGTIDLEMEADCLPEAGFPLPPVRDDFDGNELGYVWNFIYNPNSEHWSLERRKGWLTLLGGAASLNDKETSAWVGRRQQHMQCAIRTKLEFRPEQDGEEAGLSIFLNCDHHYEIALMRFEGVNRLIVRRRIGSLWKLEQSVEYNESIVILELQATEHTYSLGYAQEGERFTELGTGEVHYLSTEAGGKFTGNYMVLYATGNGQSSSTPAFFDWFEYIPIKG